MSKQLQVSLQVGVDALQQSKRAMAFRNAQQAAMDEAEDFEDVEYEEDEEYTEEDEEDVDEDDEGDEEFDGQIEEGKCPIDSAIVLRLRPRSVRPKHYTQ